MDARNTKANLSPLHSEVEALVWTMDCMQNLHQFHITFTTDCSQLGEDGFETRRIDRFYKLFGRYQDPEEIFQQFEHHSYTRTQNTLTDYLAQSARKQPSFFVNIDAELSVWFAES